MKYYMKLVLELLNQSANIGIVKLDEKRFCSLHAYACHPFAGAMLIFSVYYPIFHVSFLRSKILAYIIRLVHMRSKNVKYRYVQDIT